MNAVVKARPVKCQGSIPGWPAAVGTSCLRLNMPTRTHVGQSVVLYRLQYGNIFGKPGRQYIRQVFQSRAQRSCSQEADRSTTSRLKKKATLDIQIR